MEKGRPCFWTPHGPRIPGSGQERKGGPRGGVAIPARLSLSFPSQPASHHPFFLSFFPSSTAAVASAIANVGKLNAIFPPGTPDEEMSTSQRLQGAKNVGRALFLAALATFGGCALVFTFPDALASSLGRSLPVWVYESEKLVLTVGSALANWVMTAYFR